MQKTTLIVDSRETNVSRHSAELANIQIERKMITVGDYAIVRGGQILVSIERKSLEDYAASIKDGRITNITKMLALREQTGCRLVLLVEGKPHAKHGGIPYKAIESSMWHIALRYNVILLFTSSTVETASMLARLTLSVESMQNGHSPMIPTIPAVVEKSPPANTIEVGGDVVGAQDSIDADAPDVSATDNAVMHTPMADALVGAPPQIGALTAVHKKHPHDIARSILAVIRGITMDSADEYLKYYSPKQIISGADISKVKFASGRGPTSRAVNGAKQSCRNQSDWAKMLSRIPGITMDAADKLLGVASLPTLLTWSAESISIICIGTRPGKNNTIVQKKLPGSTVALMLECFDYRLPAC